MINIIKAIIFDLDGVILNNVNFQGKTRNEKCVWSRSIEKDLGLTHAHLELIYSYTWNDVLRGKINALDHLEHVFAHDIFKNLNLTPKIYIDYWLSHDQFINEAMINLVKSLKIPTFIGTNQDSYRTQYILSLVGSFFKGCFSSCQMGFIKTEDGFFKCIENELGLLPQEILLIDDTQAHIEQAQSNGWKVFHYQGNIDDFQLFLKSMELLTKSLKGVKIRKRNNK